MIRKATFVRDALIPGLAVALIVAAPHPASGQRGGETEPSTRVPSARSGADQGQRAGAERGTTGRALRLDEGTLRRLDTLPDSQLLEVAGRKMTVKAYKKRLRDEQKEAAARVGAMTERASPDAEALQAELDGASASRLEAANAKVAAEVAKVKARDATRRGSPRFEAIKKEAAEIAARAEAGKATPADEARARALVEQFQQLQ